MAKATGIGGVFFRSADIKATAEWYERCLGVETQTWDGGCFSEFKWRELDDPDKTAYTVWSPFNQKTEYFDPGGADFMINYRVDDLDAVLEHLKAQGVEIVGDTTEEPYGRFAWIIDIDGRKVELWEPAAEAAETEKES
ncbi:MAG: VOC family protein [Pseudomonadota bacterium]